jgi:hypothetical protein
MESNPAMTQSSLLAIHSRIKSLLMPLYMQKKWIERVKYSSQSISYKQTGHDIVRQHIESGIAAIGKIGESELCALNCYLKNRDSSGFCEKWDKRSQRLYYNAGVFPHTNESFSQFCRIMLDCLSSIDCMAVWFNRGEATVVNDYATNARLVGLNTLEPFLWNRPWMELAKGKRVLAISPFAETILSQHESISDVWKNKPQMAPAYDLEVIKTPLCAALVESPFRDWQEGLESLKSEMETMHFDIAIIGAGAWSLPLAVHAKKMQKVGVHLGGAAQLIFGIWGHRWDNKPRHGQYFNEFWVRPSNSERPETFRNIENGCYW